MPSRFRNALLTLLVLGVVLALDFFWDRVIPDPPLRTVLLTIACNVVVAVSLNVINGMAGQFSIGHAGFVGMGAYASAVVATQLHDALGGGKPFEPPFAQSFIVVPVALICSAIVCGIFGLLLGLPSLRLKGDYLAIVTLGFAEIFRLIISTQQPTTETPGDAWAAIGGEDGVVGGFFHWIGVLLSRLGGAVGYAGTHNRGVPLYAGPLWVFGVAILVGVLAWRLKFSGWGRALRALREDEIAAAAVGVDPTRYKVTSFVIAAIGGGIAGGLMALMRQGTPIVSPDSFGFQASFDAIVMVIIGGSGSVTGAALGAIFFTASIKLIEYVQALEVMRDLRSDIPWLDFNALRMIVYAAVLVALMIFRPEGILGERELFQKKGAKGSRKEAVAVGGPFR